LRAAPSQRGIDAGAVLALLDDIEQAGLELHTFMLWRDGVVAEGWRWPYSATRPRMSHSMTKSILACAIGMLIESGQLALTDTVASFFPEAGVVPGSHAAAMTVEDLLTMRSGHGAEVSGSVWRGISTSWVAEFFKIPIPHPPGTVHVYSSAASYMLSAIVTRITGETADDYLRPRLFEPLGMRDVRWDIGPDGINPGGNGITFTTADGLKLGILHAQHGIWNGQRLLPQWWVEAATRVHTADYGYHWVIGDTYYCALGQFVQAVIVYPEHDAVLAINAAMDESKVVLPHLKRHLPGAFTRGGSPDDDRKLAERLAGWAAVPRIASEAPGDPAALTGHWNVEANALGIEALDLAFADDGELRLTIGDGSIAAPCDGWRETRATLSAPSLHHGYALANAPTVAGYRWTAPDAIELVLHFAETTFRDTLHIRRAGATLELDRSVNINSAARAWPTLRATR
jgi:CubicO group peptidase (beta-lactamase class C family)